MKKISLQKKDILYIGIISVSVIVIAALSIMLYFESAETRISDAQKYYNNKIHAFSCENTNFAKEQIVFIGDSITDLCPLDEYYADLDVACYNRGIGGDRTQGVIDRLKVSVFDLNPSKIVLMIGTNDINAGMESKKIVENYRKILDTIKENQPTVELYFMSIIPEGKDLESYSNLDVSKNNETIKKLNAEIEGLCSEYGYTYVDINSYLVDENGYLRTDCSDDGLHLNAGGFEIWANMLKPYLQDKME